MMKVGESVSVAFERVGPSVGPVLLVEREEPKVITRCSLFRVDSERYDDRVARN